MRYETLTAHIKGEPQVVTASMDGGRTAIWIAAEATGDIYHAQDYGTDHDTGRSSVRVAMEGEASIHLSVEALRQLVDQGSRILAELDEMAEVAQ